MSDRYRTPKPKSRLAPAAVIMIIFAVLTAAGSLAAFIIYLLPNYNQVGLYEHYPELSENRLYIVLGSERINFPTEPVYLDGNIYLPADFIKEYFDQYLFWDSLTGRLTVTAETKVIRMQAGESDYNINNEPAKLNLAVIMQNGMFYLPGGLVAELYGYDVHYSAEYKMTMVDDRRIPRLAAEITEKDAPLRYEANKKSPIQIKLGLYSRVSCYDEIGDYTRVRTEGGLIGFVLTKQLGGATAGSPQPSPAPEAPKAIIREGKVKLLWDQIGSIAGNSREEKRIPVDGLTVLSPTWFSFDKEKMNGDIISLADASYVEWAHDQGYEVWGLVTDNFNSKVSHLILSDTLVREYVINQLLGLASEYKLDGINIDFENVKKEDKDFYLQFIRELAPFMRERGLILSVDMYVPKPYNMYYNRTEVGKSADYIIIMGYDEHHATSDIAGPVASIGFVEEGIANTLLEVPREKIILGLPFYTRVWREEQDGAGKVTSRSYSMDRGWNIFTDRAIEPTWDTYSGTYYAAYNEVEDNIPVVYHSWLETTRSITEKLKLAKEYGLAGIAGWSRGLEDPAVWELINDYIK